MDPSRRAAQVAELSERVVKLEADVERLNQIVGDPEDVPDEHGYLPRDRRPWSLFDYQERRIRDVRELREGISKLEAQRAAASDRAERSRLDGKLGFERFHLDALLAVPRLEAEDMCADCVSPAHGRGFVKAPFAWPCPAWPDQSARLARVWEMLRSSRKGDEPAASTPPHKPAEQPLAVVPSGLSIAEVVARLQELQQQHPEAQVRRGRANRWELWPKKSDDNRNPGPVGGVDPSE